MKIKEGFILREVAGNNIVVAVGNAVKTFNGVINLNQTGAFLWKILQEGAEKEDLVKALLDAYEVDEQTAKSDVDVFIGRLQQANLIK